MSKEWTSLTALVTHHTVMRELLPCLLILPTNTATTNDTGLERAASQCHWQVISAHSRCVSVCVVTTAVTHSSNKVLIALFIVLKQIVSHHCSSSVFAFVSFAVVCLLFSWYIYFRFIYCLLHVLCQFCMAVCVWNAADRLVWRLFVVRQCCLCQSRRLVSKNFVYLLMVGKITIFFPQKIDPFNRLNLCAALTTTCDSDSDIGRAAFTMLTWASLLTYYYYY